MHTISNSSLWLKNYFSLLLCLMPVSFIAGNLLINFNIIIIVISALIFFKKDIFKIKYLLLDKFLFFYFGLIIFTAIYNDYSFYLSELAWKGYFSTLLKSISFFRYLLMYLVLRYLIEKNLINIKYFFIICGICSLFVCFDILLQFFIGQDIFGLKPISPRKLSGPFGDELIAGSFIQRFSILSFFIFPLFFSNVSKIYLNYLTIFLFVIFLIGIILSGNRMPMLLFVFSIFLIIIFNKEMRKFLFSFTIILVVLFSLIHKYNDDVRNNFSALRMQVSQMIIIVINNDFGNKSKPQYLNEFSTFYDTWLMNKYIGGGIKNFRYYCHARPNIDKNSKFICNMHPHNYYLEILTETGLLGLVILLIFFSLVLYKTFYKKYFTYSTLQSNNQITPFIFLFIVEIFPIKSTGSFFTTGNTTYLFLVMAILIGLCNQDNLIDKKH
jgi:O-antigen ligase